MRNRVSLSHRAREISLKIHESVNLAVDGCDESLAFWNDYPDHKSYHAGYRDGLKSVELYIENAVRRHIDE